MQDTDPEFTSIDDPNLNWPPFVLAMLRLGRILTQKEHIRRELTAQQVSRLMERHRLEVHRVYRPLEIRENFEYYGCYIVGGGVKVEGYELSISYKNFRHYHFTFTRILRPEDVKPEVNSKPKDNQ